MAQQAVPFAGGGLTLVWVLAESHLVLHLWPEEGYATVDLHVCDYRESNAAKARRLREELARLCFAAGSGEWQEMAVGESAPLIEQRKGARSMRLNSGPIGRTLRIAAVSVVCLAALASVAKAQDVGVFVSSETTDGSIDEMGFAVGLDSADAICNRLGTAAFPGSGPWVAWLSTRNGSNEDAGARVPTPGSGGAYVRAAEPATVIATGLADLTDGTLTASILLDETGTPVTTPFEVWTGTAAAGTFLSPDCSNWASNNFEGRFGTTTQTTGTWTNEDTDDCNENFRLYCFGPLPLPAPALPPLALLALGVLLLVGGAYLYRRRQLVA